MAKEGYGKETASLSKGGAKDQASYKSETGGAKMTDKKSAKIDSLGGVKSKNESCYKEAK